MLPCTIKLYKITDAINVYLFLTRFSFFLTQNNNRVGLFFKLHKPKDRRCNKGLSTKEDFELSRQVAGSMIKEKKENIRLTLVPMRIW